MTRAHNCNAVAFNSYRKTGSIVTEGLLKPSEKSVAFPWSDQGLAGGSFMSFVFLSSSDLLFDLPTLTSAASSLRLHWLAMFNV